jgi:hypothetical protein
MPNKPKKRGIKIWSLCDAVSGFNLRWNVYVGKKNESENDDDGLGYRVVTDFVKDFDRGYKVFMDNFFTSPKLFADLKSKGIGACGTIRTNRKGVVADIAKTKLKMKKGDDPIFFEKDGLLLTTWQDTARVTCLSSIHSSDVVEKK